MSGNNTVPALLVPLALAIAAVVKVALYFFIARFRLRARTAFLASLNLANCSEYGLIVDRPIPWRIIRNKRRPCRPQV